MNKYLITLVFIGSILCALSCSSSSSQTITETDPKDSIIADLQIQLNKKTSEFKEHSDSLLAQISLLQDSIVKMKTPFGKKFHSKLNSDIFTDDDIDIIIDGFREISSDFVDCVYPLWLKYNDDPLGLYVFSLLFSEGFPKLAYANTSWYDKTRYTLFHTNRADYEGIFSHRSEYSSQITLNMIMHQKELHIKAMRNRNGMP